MGGCKACQWIVLLLCLQGLFEVKSHYVDITYVKSAVEKGAVCLDGSPPAYHLSPGFGAGVDSWLIQLDGGGWCDSPKSCLHRRDTGLGSSEAMEKQVDFSGILSNIQNSNPDFYNWNKVRVRYCDGSSFTGDIEDVDPHTKLHYRGARVFQAVMEELLAKGMNNAEQALFSGCSAGALAVILHCDNFRSLLPGSAKVKCLSDAGYFINTRDITGTPHMEGLFKNVVETHGSAKNLPSSCTSRMSPGLCFFPQNVASDIQTPLFILNGAYDSWQIKNILAPRSADPRGTWKDCKADIRKCSRTELHSMQVYRKLFLIAIEQGGMPSSRGLYISSCYVHCQARGQGTWLADDSPRLDNTPIGEAVGDWYFDRRPFQKIDCPYPCDKSCHNRVYKDDELEDSFDAVST